MEVALKKCEELVLPEFGVSSCHDGTGRITDWNHGAEVLYGFTKAEALGHTNAELLRTESAVAWPAILKELQAGHDWHGEFWNHCRDGALVAVAAHLLPDRHARGGGYVEINVDITALKQTEAALRTSEHTALHQFNELASIYASAPVGLAFLDTHLRFVKVNQRLADFNGRTVAEHLDHTLREVLPAQADHLEPLLQAILVTGKPLLNVELRTLTGPAPGTERFLMSNYYPVKNEFIFGLNMTMVDITEHKATQLLQKTACDEIAGHARRLEMEVTARTSELKASVNELEAFSYSLSHDLRAPVRAIHGFTELVLQDAHTDLSGQSIEYLSKVVDAARRADQLIQDVLTISRLSVEPIKLQPVNIEQLLHEILAERIEWRDCAKATIEIAGPLRPVQGQAAYLTQCLTNLLANAVKFVAPGVTPHVRIGTDAAGAQVRLWIADNGIGIPAADRPRLFKIFSRLNSPDAYEGTGIGLAIVQRAVERMGGTVGVESEPGHGSRFWLLLPKAEEE